MRVGEAMKISLKCFAKLSEANVCDFRDGDEREISSGETVRSVVKQLGFQPDDIQIIFVNGKITELDTVLRDGDRLGLAPAEGGM
jgi:sulfur carrier protein ThiS